ncbi:MAG: CRISPR-associated endonuclease Cas1, partial [Acidimicrobiales bacterium]
MRVLSTLYVKSHRAKVGLQKQALMVTSPEGKTRVPLESLDAVVLLGSAQVTSDALAACVERGVRLASLRRNGRVRFVVGGPVGGNVHLRLAQTKAASDPGHVAALARWFVAGKLQNYRRLLLRWSWDARPIDRNHLRNQAEIIATRLDGLGGVVDGDRIRGIEGDATRRYFKGLAAQLTSTGAGLHFVGRSRRPPRDPVNALLSFLYGLVTTELIGALDAVGLDPQIGYLHGVRSGRPALALDLLEEFRPAQADRLAVRLIARRQVRESHFVTTPGGACYLTDDGRSVVLSSYEDFKAEEVPHPLLGRDVPRWALPSLQATLVARHLRGDLPAYPPFLI